MDTHVWRAMVEAIKAGHTETLKLGFTLKPQLHAFVAGKLVGYIQLRPVQIGSDAISGIAEMADFAAAAHADEILVAWETQDIALACELPARHEGAGLNIVWASAEQRNLCSFTYQEQEIGYTESGYKSVAPIWSSSASVQPADDLEPAITALIDFSFQPFETEPDDLFQKCVTLLESRGHRIRLTV